MKSYKIITIIFLLFLTFLNAQEKIDSIIKLDNDGFREMLVQVNDVFISGQPEKKGLDQFSQYLMNVKKS